MSDNLRGAFLMVGSMAAFVLNDTLVKILGVRLPLFQILLLRGLFTVFFVATLCHFFCAWQFNLSGRDWRLVIIRSFGDIGASYFFLTALFHMPLANVTAILQLLPLTISLGGALFFNEKLGWRSFLVIAVGFVGMGLIARPAAEGFGIYSFYGICAVLCVTVRDLVTRRISPNVPSLLVTFVNALGILLYSTIAIFWVEWVPVTGQEVIKLGIASGFVSVAYLLSVLVMRKGDLVYIAPFRYSGLLWALLIGLIVFDHWPDRFTFLGAGIIISSGLYIMWREASLKTKTALV